MRAMIINTNFKFPLFVTILEELRSDFSQRVTNNKTNCMPGLRIISARGKIYNKTFNIPALETSLEILQ
jgi:hypothetical protein